MIKIVFLSLFIFCHQCFVIKAQKNSGDKKIKEARLALQNDTGYKRFQGQLQQALKQAKGKNSNAAAVRELFKANKNLMQNLHNKYSVAFGPSGGKPSTGKPSSVKPSIKRVHLKGLTEAVNYVYNYVPPYEEKYRYSYSGLGMAPTVETGSDERMGKIAYTSAVENPVHRNLGELGFGFLKSITVPSDPTILAARVKFDYSFFQTGWDTFWSSLSPELILQMSRNFKSDDFDNLPIINWFHKDPVDRWRSAAKLGPLMSNSNEFIEFSNRIDTSFTTEGYIIPGTKFTFRIGPAYNRGNQVGTDGCYHYSEFYLKKITVTYLKAGQ